MKNKLMDLLLGKPAPDDGAMQVSMDYGKDLQNYMDTLPQQSYAQNLYNGNLTKEQVNQGIANGLNFGIPQIKAKQEELKIRVPQTQAEVELARNGQFNNYPLVTSIKNVPRQGGLLRDFKGGFDENINQPFGVSNLEPNRNKNLATRFGEGFGTAIRLLDNPLVRGAIAYGLSNRFGDRNPLEQGIMAAGLNMQNKMKDRVYRDSLIKTAQQSRMSDVDFAGLSPEQQRAELNNIANRINSYRGYIGDDIYGQIIQAQQLRDNAQYRNMLLQSNMRNQEEMMKWRIAEAQRQARQDERDYNLDAQRVGLQARGLDLEEQKLNQNKNAGGIANLQAVNQQLQRFEDSFKNMPNKLESNTLGRLRNFTGLQTQTEANFNSQRQLLFNKIARDLGGEKGVLSDQDIKRIEGALPSYTDSYAQKQAKMQAIYDLLNDRLSVEGGSLGQTTQSGTTQVGKYKVRVK